MDTQGQFTVYMYGFDGIQRGNYFRGEPIRKAEVKVRGELRNMKVASKDEVTGEMVTGGGEMMLDWIWKFCNIGFESGVVFEEWRSAVIVPLKKGKVLNIRIYIAISLLNVVGKIYAGILIDKVQRMTKGLMMNKWVSDQGRGV